MTQIHGVLPFISQVLGWTYTSLWSLSFYPQPILNYRRLSTVGTSIDFSLLNILGYFTYLIYNATFYFSTQIRFQYALKNNGLMPTVQLNDIAYSIHAFILTTIVYSQFLFSSWWGFEERKRALGARHSKVVYITFGCCLLGVFAVGILVLVKHLEDPLGRWAAIDIIYAISYVKLVTTIFKYIPQVRINYVNKSTEGFAVDQILLDLSGGIASTLQLVVDSYYQGDWSGVTGNPTKLLLGNITIFFDVIFLTQHYCLYSDDNCHAIEEQEPLLEE
ncbi:Cystinosin-like protein [Erysiphe neolycopersici]|uniref:Cystinosin-like protein n=1 Tax=Erysiphe neolycopersici TaxID=212602 RepID=A0A420I4B3_9PEZI|nr:Cystinosin-like protein [Erysiphe neolycopersici]